MNLVQAKRLSNGSTVYCKVTGEPITVLHAAIKPSSVLKGHSFVSITGRGRKSGFQQWNHRQVR